MRIKNEREKAMENNSSFSDKVLIAAGYIFWLPAFYIILTGKRKNKFLALHSAQALLLWLTIICISVLLKLAFNVLLSIVFIPFFYFVYDVITFLLWLYCIYCAILFMIDKDFEIPLVSRISRKLI